MPSRYRTPQGSVIRRCLAKGDDWQIYDCGSDYRVLAVHQETAAGWVAVGLMPDAEVHRVSVSGQKIALVEGGVGCRVDALCLPNAAESVSEAEAFAVALRESLRVDPGMDTSDAVYVERLSRVLPTTAVGEQLSPDRLLGVFITGGVDISVRSSRRLLCLAPWLSMDGLTRVSRRLDIGELEESAPARESAGAVNGSNEPLGDFELPGRPAIAAFLNEHVVDIVRNPERYERLGVGFPGAVLLHGPPGSGKTYAIERLVDFLGWPCLSVDCGSIGSPYIHETGRKIAAIFEEAAKVAPSVLLIDEIDAFLSARDESAGSQHRVEEVSEFLRRIPEAAKSKVLVIGMTNRLASLDPAIVRRGRFDHIVEVGMPSREEVLAALQGLLAKVPVDASFSPERAADVLSGRPMSDVAFVVKEACRRAAKRGALAVSEEDINSALDSTGSRVENKKRNRIGFV